ncbi:MAG: (2Fe-2S)-binding protein [Nannocystaceae bacterium]
MDAASALGYPKRGVSRILCQCLLVDERDVVATIRAGARTVDEVGERCDAGTGCGSCRAGIDLLIRAEVRRRSRSSVPEQLLAQLGLFGRDSDG